MEILNLINENTGLITLGLLLLAVETRVHIKTIFYRLKKLEDAK